MARQERVYKMSAHLGEVRHFKIKVTKDILQVLKVTTAEQVKTAPGFILYS
jgi:hypothetical protein